jgi:hypothetical protein
MMRWTRWASLTAGLIAAAGCGYGFRTAPTAAHYSATTRPEGSYFCYDCHGYRYFDPYYDYCASYGFRYHWSRHPEAMAIYRERYVRIKENHPDFGGYRYREGYQSTPGYQEPRDYDRWRSEAAGKPATGMSQHKAKESKPKEKHPGNPDKTDGRQGDERKGPRDFGSRLSLRGGTS